MSLAVSHDLQSPSGFDRLPGVTPPSSRERRPGFLTDTIVELGLVDGEQIETAIHDSRVRGVPPEILLLERGTVSGEDLARARAEHAGLDYVDLDEFDRDNEADAAIGLQAAERHRALPLTVEGRTLVVAFADPLDAPAIAEIAAMAKLDVSPVVAAADAIETRVATLPKRDATDDEPVVAAPVLQPVPDRGAQRPEPLSGDIADRIVERVDAAIDEVTRSEVLRALDDATAEIERLSAELDQANERARALEAERDELLGS